MSILDFAAEASARGSIRLDDVACLAVDRSRRRVVCDSSGLGEDEEDRLAGAGLALWRACWPGREPGVSFAVDRVVIEESGRRHADTGKTLTSGAGTNTI